ncbi:MAG: TerB family tellurite resistance protein [Gloeomargarita sp. SKYG116]|nr:TerB family tellurite resistance protein [Gloeomargarita sp. SKYG116]MDW8400509.1 TerB family tellurite resistance protein [Gloeomargarita sp. SKYGB_i_bin116]
MRYVWQCFRQPVSSALTLNRQEALTALATAMIAIDDEVSPLEMTALRTQLTALGIDVDAQLLAQVQRWLQSVDPLELFWAGVRGIDPADRETAVKLVAKLALADGVTLVEENDLVAVLGETFGMNHAQIRTLVQQATHP